MKKGKEAERNKPKEKMERERERKAAQKGTEKKGTRD